MKWLLCLVPLLWGCSERISGGGGGIETGNALAVRIVDTASVPVPGAQGRLLPIDFRSAPGDTQSPSALRVAVSDSAGWIRTSLPRGAWRLEVTRGDVSAWWGLELSDRDTVVPDSLVLRRRGRVHGMALLPQGVARAWVRLPGRAGGTWSDAQGNWSLDSLPAGKLELEALFGATTGGATLTLQPGQDTLLDLAPALEGTRRDTLYLDALRGGVSRPVPGFPLLLRLDSSWFPFHQAKPDGSDLLARSGGNLLPMEIERWDSAAGRAEVWVRLDVSDRDSLPVVLEWGGAAGKLSRGSSVFRRGEGFQAVWHLGNGADATAAGDDLVLQGTAPDTAVIALGRRFRNDSASAVGWNWPGPGEAIQFDAWVQPSALGPSYDALLSTGTAGPRLHRFGDVAGPCFSLPTGTGSASACSAMPLDDGAAHLVTGQWARDTLRLWFDGTLQAVQPAKPAEMAAMPLWLGRHPGGLGVFAGLLDEVRIQDQARSADWIRLSWATQRPGSTILRHR